MSTSVIALFRERPASRLTVVEGAGAVLFAAVTLPVSTPDQRRVPDWVQLAGLVMLLVLYGTALHTWRAVMVRGLRPGPAMRRRAGDDRRLRVLVLSYPVLIALLVPIPATWTPFWFWLTLAGAIGGAVSLTRTAVAVNRRAVPDTGAGHAGIPGRTATWARRWRSRRS
ncbi:hypothetical protein [Actinomadura chibensis]|uniref:Uncharacterized protein n=1 Tax=Actinomadura chibensis TaxID=392828 RepID=A0A5D0NXA7_9ACTN|nr:hypothetical protein [Actinomadura chibensis]TYB48848.1 hypothetical protein FXF69_06750 [Actinomadura chibensis]